jgi:hypothetical protein
MKSLLILIALFFSFSSYSQDQKYNIPPGSVIRKKGVEQIDYSWKLKNISQDKAFFKDSNYLVRFTLEELNEMEKNSIDKYNYYKTADNYFKALSPKVKSLFSIDELWYIYMFDETLKEKIKTIK